MNRPDLLCIPDSPTNQFPVIPKDKKTEEVYSKFSDPKKFEWVYRRRERSDRKSSEWCILPLTSRDYPSPAPIAEPTKE